MDQAGGTSGERRGSLPDTARSPVCRIRRRPPPSRTGAPGARRGNLAIERPVYRGHSQPNVPAVSSA